MKTRVGFSIGKIALVWSVALALFLAGNGKLSAQDTYNNEEVFVVADEMPSFPGEMKALYETIGKNLRYPETAKEKGIEGKVLVKFIIDKEGNVVNPVIVRSVDAALDKAALDAVKKLPKFKPGKIGGKPVNVWYSIPIAFKITNI